MNNNKNASARIRITQKENLTPEQVQHLEWRLSQPEHQFDCGPPEIWDASGHEAQLFVALLVGNGEPVGLAYRAGSSDNVEAGWWIDSKFRGKGYGSELIDRLIEQLLRESVTGIGEIAIKTFRGEYDVASQRMATRLKLGFAN